MYAAKTGRMAFSGDTVAELASNIKAGEFQIGMDELYGVQFADILQQMLAKDPNARPTAMKVLEHPWVTGELQVPPEKFFCAALFRAVAHADNDTDLKRVMACKRALLANADVIAELKKSFCLVDRDRDGGISVDEVHQCLINLEFSEADAMEFSYNIVKEFDRNHDGFLTLDDYITLFFRAQLSLDLDYMEETFVDMTDNKRNFLEAKIVESYVGSDVEYIEAILQTRSLTKAWKQADVDKDGRMSFNDYWYAMKNFDGIRKTLNDNARDGSIDVGDVEPNQPVAQE